MVATTLYPIPGSFAILRCLLFLILVVSKFCPKSTISIIVLRISVRRVSSFLRNIERNLNLYAELVNRWQEVVKNEKYGLYAPCGSIKYHPVFLTRK